MKLIKNIATIKITDGYGKQLLKPHYVIMAKDIIIGTATNKGLFQIRVNGENFDMQFEDEQEMIKWVKELDRPNIVS